MSAEYPEVKPITIRGQKFAIRRFTDEDDEKLSAVTKDNALFRRTVILLGTTDPKFDSIEEVAKLDREISLGLYVGIQEFNVLNSDFLLRLRKLQSQVSPLLQTSKPSETPDVPS